MVTEWPALSQTQSQHALTLSICSGSMPVLQAAQAVRHAHARNRACPVTACPMLSICSGSMHVLQTAQLYGECTKEEVLAQ